MKITLQDIANRLRAFSDWSRQIAETRDVEGMTSDLRFSLHNLANFTEYPLKDLAAKQIFPNCFISTDEQGRRWDLLHREDGSLVLYYTKIADPTHYVVYDSLDKE